MIDQENDEYGRESSYLGNYQIKRHGVIEKWTPEKLREYVLCSQDPIYFIENYMKIVTLDHGLVNINLYDYQKNMIQNFHENRFNIVLSPRQSAKCVHSDTIVEISFLDSIIKEKIKIKTLFAIFASINKIQWQYLCGEKYVFTEQIYKNIPFTCAEAENAFSRLWGNASYHSKKLWWEELKRQSSLSNAEGALFSSQTISENVKTGKPRASGDDVYCCEEASKRDERMPSLWEDWKWSNDVQVSFSKLQKTAKFIDSYSGFGFYTYSINGKVPIIQAHKTKQFETWHVLMNNKEELLCADTHTVINETNERLFVKDLKTSDRVKTKFGVSEVEKIENTHILENMYDLSINSTDHTYFTNNIVSHNTTSVVSYLLWYACFNSDKTVAILANKGATANEILARFTLALENIPFFLQPGCKVLNKSSIKFSNNTRVIARATSSSSIRGESVNLLAIDEFGFIQNAETFYTATYPVITAGKSSKVIITSTPNGVGNPFHSIWTGAITKTLIGGMFLGETKNGKKKLLLIHLYANSSKNMNVYMRIQRLLLETNTQMKL